MAEIFLAGLDYEHEAVRVATIRGVRGIWDFLGLTNEFRPARELVDEFIATPTVMRKIADAPDADTAEKAIQAAMERSDSAAIFVIDPEDLELPDPSQPDPDYAEDEDLDDGPFSPAAYETTIMLLHMNEAKPIQAYWRAYQLAHVTEDVSLYQEVQAIIAKVFELEFGPDGPDIHIVGASE